MFDSLVKFRGNYLNFLYLKHGYNRQVVVALLPVLSGTIFVRWIVQTAIC
ncbi:hypothetical protein NUACC26_093240 [Scytonema sp. NUACC26]